MSNPEYQPNDPQLFEQLAVNLQRLTADFGKPFVVDADQNDYPAEPNNLRALGDKLFPVFVEFEPSAVDGRAMYALSRANDGDERHVIAYAFNESRQERYRRLGEVIINTPPLAGSMTLDIHRLETSGVVLTSSEPDHVALRRLEDYELAHLVEVADAATPAW